MSEKRQDGFYWVRFRKGGNWTIGDLAGDLDIVVIIGEGMPARVGELEFGPRIEPPRSPVHTVDADGNHMLRWDDGSPLRTEVHVLATAGTPVGTLTVNDGALMLLGPSETARFHARLREDGTLEWVADKTVVEPED